MADHLSIFAGKESDEPEININDMFPDEQIFTVTLKQPLGLIICQLCSCGLMSDGLKFYQQKRFLFGVNKYFMDEPYFFIKCADHIIRRCVMEEEAIKIIHASNASLVGSL